MDEEAEIQMVFQKKLWSSACRRNVEGHGSHGLAHCSCRGQAERKPTIWETEGRVINTKEGVCNCVCSSLQMRKKTGPLAQLLSTKPGARWGGGFPSSGVHEGGRALAGEATKRLKAKKAKMLAAVLST